MEPYGTLTRGKTRPKKISYSDLERYGTIWNNMEPYGTLPRGKWMKKKLSYSDLEPYGTIWNPN